MSMPSLLAQLLQRFLRLLASVHRKSLRSIGHLFTFLRFLRRCISRKRIRPGTVAPDQRQVRPPSLESNEKAICSMNVPAHRPSDFHEGGGYSPVDMPYRSASGSHLVPYSPSARRQLTRDQITWITGSQASLQEEHGQISGEPEPLHVTPSILRPSSRTSAHPHDDDHVQSSDSHTHTSHPPSPSYRTIGFAPDVPGDNPAPHTLTHHASHSHLGGSSQEIHRSRSPASFVSTSQRSTSQRSYNSRASAGRASYREFTNHGSSAHSRNPVPSIQQDGYNFETPSSDTLKGERAGSIVTPGGLIAPPSAVDPNQPGEVKVSELPRFAPMSTVGVLRYDRLKARNPHEVDHEIKGMTFEYPETPRIPDGWKAFRHPEGVLYFMHVESKTFTEVNICDEDILTDIENFKNFLYSELRTEIEKRGLVVSLDDVQLVLEPQRDEVGVVCRYYFVNPNSRSLFWLDDWDGYEIFKDCLGALSLPHKGKVTVTILISLTNQPCSSKGLGIQARYCSNIEDFIFIRSHWDLFPNLCIITPELKNEIVGMLLQATCDHLTSSRSSCPLNPEELKNHLSLIKNIDPLSEEMQPYSAIIIGRIMHIFYNNYFLNFHGEECARLNFDQTVHGWKYYPSILMSTFAPLLFMTPVNNVRLLHKIFVDDIASKDKWNMFVTKLNRQLQETSVLATVLLNANVAFLPKQSGTGTSPQQFLSYMSLASSMASIILALVFMGHNRTDARNNPFETAKFLHGLRHERHGLETLAVAYSLPRALLIWGMVLFFAAFAAQWWISGNIASVCSVMLVVALLVVWCIWIARDRSEFWWFQSDPNQIALEDHEDTPDMSFLSRLRRHLYQRIMIMMPWADQRVGFAGSHEMQEAPGIHDSPNDTPSLLVTVPRPS